MTRWLPGALLWIGATLGLVAVAAGLGVALLGSSFLVFRSGSMAPAIPTGALALSRTVPASEVEAGDVVSVLSSGGQRITHRVVGTTVRGEKASLILQGDANATPDDEVYRVRSVERVWVSVPWAGYVLVHALSPPGLLAVGCLSLVLLLGGPSRTPADGETARTRSRHRRRRLVGLGAVVALGTGVLPVLSQHDGMLDTLASFTDRPTAATGAFAATPYFTCNNAALTNGSAPYLYYKLDETPALGVDGAAADSSGNGRAGSYRTNPLNLVGGKTYGAARACARDTGTSVTFNGSSGYLASPATAAVNAGNPVTSFTVSAWVRTTANLATGGKIIGFGNAATGASTSYDRHLYLANSGAVFFGVFTSAGEIATIDSGATRVNDGAWHQVVATMSPTEGIRLHVDGVQVAANPASTTAQAYGTPGYWRVAYDNLANWPSRPTSDFLAATLDEVVVYTTPLSAATVAATYRAGR